jgi:hypothetical protein
MYINQPANGKTKNTKTIQAATFPAIAGPAKIQIAPTATMLERPQAFRTLNIIAVSIFLLGSTAMVGADGIEPPTFSV